MQIPYLSRILCTFLVLLFYSSSLAFSSPTKQLLLSSQTQSLYTQLLEFSKTNIDPSSLTITVNNQDVTKRVDFTQVGSTVLLEYKLLTNLPAKANTEFVIRAKTRGTVSEPSVDIEAKSEADIIGKFAVAPVHIIKIPSYEGVLEDAQIATPVSVFSNGAINILYQEGDRLENFRIDVPVFALDEKGSHLNIDLDSIQLSGLSSGISSGSSSMTAGMAVIPLTVTSSNLDSLDIGVGTITIGSSSGAGALLRPQALFVLAVPVIVLTAEQAATVFIGLGLAVNAILNPDPPRVPFRDWIRNEKEAFRFSPVTVPTLTNGGQCSTKPVSVLVPVLNWDIPFPPVPPEISPNPRGLVKLGDFIGWGGGQGSPDNPDPNKGCREAIARILSLTALEVADFVQKGITPAFSDQISRAYFERVNLPNGTKNLTAYGRGQLMKYVSQVTSGQRSLGDFRGIDLKGCS